MISQPSLWHDLADIVTAPGGWIVAVVAVTAVLLAVYWCVAVLVDECSVAWQRRQAARIYQEQHADAQRRRLDAVVHLSDYRRLS